MTAKRIPATLKPREGEHILITIPHYWGKGETLASARANLREAGAIVGKYWRVHSVHPDTYVEGVHGYINHPTGHPPHMLAECNPSSATA